MKLIASIFLFVLPATAQDIPLERFSVPGFSAGVVSRYSPILIPDNSLQHARNIYVDELGITRRKGYSQFNSAAFTDTKSVRLVAPFTADDGTRYILALSSRTIYKAGTDGVFTTIPGLSNLSATSEMDAVAYLGKIWFANGTDAMAYWNGASTKTVTEGPLGSMIEGWRNRIVTAGIAGSLSYVYMSKELDGEEWTTGPTTSVDPVALAFGGSNAKPVKCVYGGFKDFLFVGNEDEIYGVYGFGRNDFVIRTISREVGCIEDKSVQEKDGALYWMSRRGIEKMTNQADRQRISDGVKDVFDTLIDNTAVNRLRLYTTQAHWEAGNLAASGPGAKISTTISLGSIVPSTWSHTDTAGADWAAGTQSNTSTTTTPGSLEIGYEDFEDLNYTANPVWTIGSGVMTSTGGRFQAITNNGVAVTSSTEVNKWGFSFYPTLRIGSGGKRVLFMSSVSGGSNFGSPSSGGPLYLFYSNSPDSKPTIGYRGADSNGVDICSLASYETNNEERNYTITRTNEGLFTLTSSNGESCSGTNTTLNTSSYFGVAFTGASGTYIDNIVGIRKSTGIFISPVFDTALSTPTGGPFSFTETVPVGSTIAYSVRASSTSVLPTWDTWTLVSTTTSGVYRIPLTKQFWQYKADFSTSYSTQTPALNDVTLQAATTAEYIHDCTTTGDIASWGNFQANSVLTGAGAIAYYVSTGTSCNSVERATSSWTAQFNNAPILLSTAAYIGVKELFTITSSTEQAILRDVTVNWLEGTARPPIASSIYKERYYLAYTTVAATNNYVFVSDKNDAPTFLDGITCYSLALFNRKMFCGDSNATGKIYQLETGESDNGAAFTSSFRTKAYSFGDPDAEKEFIKAYASFVPEADSALDINITPSYHLDLSTTAIMLNPVNTGEDATAGMLVAKIPFAASNNLTGRFMDMEFTHTSNSGGFTLFGLNFYYKRYDVK